MSRGHLVVGGERVGTIPLPPGTRDATLPRPQVPADVTRFDERPDGLAVDASLEAYGRKRWSPNRWNPFRSRWPEVAELDERVSRLEERQADTVEELKALLERLPQAEAEDKDALADWVAEPAGERPLPSAPVVEQRIRELEHERDALEVAIRRVLDEKEAYVAKHRKRLRSEAAKTRREAVERLNATIATLEQARAEVVASVEAERWAAEFPGPEADASPLRLPLVRGGRLSTAMPELRVQVAFERIAGLLRHDAAWLDEVTADEDDDGELDLDKQAVWEQTDEGRKALARKNEEVREAIAPRNVSEAGWG